MHCWNDAKKVSGRDEGRWRLDAAGNPVLKGQHGEKYKNSPYAFNYDSDQKGNCQLLQHLVKEKKGGAKWSTKKIKDVSATTLDKHSKNLFKNRKDKTNMDSQEKIHYGSIKSSPTGTQTPVKPDNSELDKKIADLTA